jgi:D-glycero-alpha-D-manno-heptose 1-phosphate guanylyltransferase
MEHQNALQEDLAMVPAIVLCGGKGTRIQKLTGDQIPKALVQVGERTLLDHTLDLLASNGMRRAILAMSHRSQQVKEHLQWARSALEINISETEQPLGVIPSVAMACSQYALSSTILLTGADEICEGLDLAPVLQVHRETRSMATMVLTADVAREFSSLRATVDSQGRITTLARGRATFEYTATGIAFLEPSFIARGLELTRRGHDPESLLNVLMPQLIAEKSIYGVVRTMRRYLHIGTEEAFQAARISYSAQ